MTAKPTARRARRGSGARTAFDRQALIDQLTRSDGGLEDILAKSPRDLTEAEVRQVAEHRLALAAGTQKEALDRFERAFYDDAYGTDLAEADETGRLMAPAARRPVSTAPVPARTADGMDLSRAIGRLAERVADIAETQGSRDAVRFLQRGLTILNQAVTETCGDDAMAAAPTNGPMFQDLVDDGDPGPKTRAALRTASARLGSPKIEEALALGRFEAALRGLADGTSASGLRDVTSASFAELFREPAAVGPHIPTEEGESLQMTVKDLRAGIRRALLADRLGQIEGPRMTATEVLERVAEISRLLGATYGRLQSELLTPLVTRGLSILIRRGEVPALRIDGQTIDLEYKSPLARHQAQQDVQATLAFLDGLARLGPQALTIIDVPQAAQVLAAAFGVPSKILKDLDRRIEPATPLPADDVPPTATGDGGGGLTALASALGVTLPSSPTTGTA